MIDIEAMLDAYVECALWSSVDDDGEPLSQAYDDVSDACRESFRKDCEGFLELAAELLREGDCPEKLGCDLWLTQNRHGAGFWDGGWWGERGDELTKIAHSFGSVDLYVADGEVCCS